MSNFPNIALIYSNYKEYIIQLFTGTLSDKISKDLKKRGMSFVDSIIIYSFMQAVGLVNDHIKDCWKFNGL